jgi:hypothetical protein
MCTFWVDRTTATARQDGGQFQTEPQGPLEGKSARDVFAFKGALLKSVVSKSYAGSAVTIAYSASSFLPVLDNNKVYAESATIAISV